MRASQTWLSKRRRKMLIGTIILSLLQAPPTFHGDNQEIAQLLNRTDVKQKLFSTGTEIAAGSPSEFAARIRSELSRLGKIIKDAGIRDE